MTVSAHSGVYDPLYIKPPKYNLDLELKVLQHKQNTYDANYKHIQGLKQQALNIKFINKEAASKIDEFNKRIAENLDGDYGDLSDSSIANKYVDIFKEFNQTNLVGLYRKEADYRNTLQHINKLKKSKDPMKAGYSKIHEAVYRADLNKYATQSMDDAKDTSVDGYVPFINVAEIFQEASLKVPETETITEQTDPSTGQKFTTIVKGRDQKAVQEILGSLGQQYSDQFKVQSKYQFMAGQASPEFLTQLHTKYNNRIQGARNKVDKAIDDLNKHYRDKEKDDTYYNTAQQLQSTKESFKVLGDITQVKEEQWQDILRQQIGQELINDSTQAYAPQSISQTSDIDPVFKFTKTFSLQAANFDLKKSMFQYEMGQDAIANQLARDKFELDVAKEGLKLKDGELVSSDPTAGGIDTSYDINNPDELKLASTHIKKQAFNYQVASWNPNKGSLKFENTQYYKDLEDKKNNLFSKINQLEQPLSQMPGRVYVPLTENQRIELNELKKQYTEIDSRLKTPNLTYSHLLEEKVKNPRAFNNDPNLRDNPYIIAANEVIRDAEMEGITLTPDLLKERIETTVKDSKSRAFSKQLELEDTKILNESLQEQIENSSLDDQKVINKMIDSAIRSGDATMRLYTGKVFNLQLPDGATTSQKARISQDQLNAKNILVDNTLTGTFDVNGISPKDLAQYKKFEGGAIKMTFSDEFFKGKDEEEFTIQMKAGVSGLPEQVTFDKNNRTVIFYDKDFSPAKVLSKANFKFTGRKHYDKVNGEVNPNVYYQIKSPDLSNGHNEYRVHINVNGQVKKFSINDPAATPQQVEQAVKNIMNQLKSN